MTTPLRLAIVGCGGIAGYTTKLAQLLPGLRVWACCDRDPELVRAFARRHSIPAAYEDYAQMIAGLDLDMLYLAVPHDLHLPMVRAAVERGLSVLCEKPLAANLDQGRELLQVAAAPGTRVAVNYQYRYETASFALVQAARSGDLGRLLYARANVPWHREPGYFATGAGWHASLARSGGGTLLTQGSHFLDLLLWAMNSRPVSAAGLTRQMVHTGVEVEDLAMGLVELESGAVIDITSSMASPIEKPPTLELYGEKGIAFWQGGAIPRLRFEGVKPARQRPPGAGLHPLQRSLAAMRDWVRGGPPHLGTVEDAFATLAAVDAIYRAARSRKKEDIHP